jgi:hypothetical protein
MRTLDPRSARQVEGERRKEAAHARLEARRDVYLRRARRAFLTRLLSVGTATADDVVEMIGPAIDGIDPRWRGAVPKPLALAGITRDTGQTAKSARPEAHARNVTVWELADRAAALAWLAHNPDLPDPEPEDGDGDVGGPRPAPPTPPPPALSQLSLF